MRSRQDRGIALATTLRVEAGREFIANSTNVLDSAEAVLIANGFPHLIRFDTADYPQADRERMFVHVYSLAVLVEILARPVHCRVEIHDLGEIHLRLAKTSAQRSTRLPETISIDRRTFIGVVLLLEGHISGEVDGRKVAVSPGEALIVDFGRPSALEHTDNQVITLGLERSLIARRLPWLAQMNGAVVRGERAQLLSEHLTALADRLRSGSAQSAEIESHGTAEVLAGVFPDPADVGPSARSRADDLKVFKQATAYIDASLTCMDLKPSAIWKASNVSRSRLYRLFAPVGGVSKYIVNHRLKLAYACLENPKDHRTVAKIAHDSGFANVAHFARAFRDAFGMTANQVRRASARNHADPMRLEGPAAASGGRSGSTAADPELRDV